MKYKPDIQLENGEWFKHGDSLMIRGKRKHVDCIGKMVALDYTQSKDAYFEFIRPATKEEIEKHCK